MTCRWHVRAATRPARRQVKSHLPHHVERTPYRSVFRFRGKLRRTGSFLLFRPRPAALGSRPRRKRVRIWIALGVLRTVREDGSFFYLPSGTLQMRGQICSLTIRQNVEVLLAYLNKLHNERPQPRRRKRQAHMVKIPQYQRLPDNAPKVT
jgi:hypothetical protein